MSDPALKPWTIDQFFEWQTRQKDRYERPSAPCRTTNWTLIRAASVFRGWLGIGATHAHSLRHSFRAMRTCGFFSILISSISPVAILPTITGIRFGGRFSP